MLLNVTSLIAHMVMAVTVELASSMINKLNKRIIYFIS
ncbi:MAG: hypothetical protein ACJAXH_002447, partial [Colwellia sp.]